MDNFFFHERQPETPGMAESIAIPAGTDRVHFTLEGCEFEFRRAGERWNYAVRRNGQVAYEGMGFPRLRRTVEAVIEFHRAERRTA